MPRKVGRNQSCPCGSGRKFKKCHMNAASAEQSMKKPVDPMSPEFQAKAWKLFDDKMAAEKKRKEQFGDVMPIIHAEAWDKRIVGVGNRIYFAGPKASFLD